MAAQDRVAKYSTNGFLTSLLQFMQILSGILAMPLAGTVLLASLLIGPVLAWRAALPGLGLNDTQARVIENTLLRGIDFGFSIAVSLAIAALACMLVTWLLFIIWAWRKFANLPSLGAKNLRYRGILWMLPWFVPIVNFFVPLGMMWQLWSASDPSGLIDRRQEARSSLSVTVWWVSFLLSLGWFMAWLGFVAIYLFVLKQPLPGWDLLAQTSSAMLIVAGVLTVSSVAAVLNSFLGVRVVDILTQMQTDRHRLFQARQTAR